jgi:hypothetical protein
MPSDPRKVVMVASADTCRVEFGLLGSLTCRVKSAGVVCDGWRVIFCLVRR